MGWDGMGLDEKLLPALTNYIYLYFKPAGTANTLFRILKVRIESSGVLCRNKKIRLFIFLNIQ